MKPEEIQYHKNVIDKLDKIISRYSIRENNELHTVIFDVKQSHAVLLSKVSDEEFTFPDDLKKWEE